MAANDYSNLALMRAMRSAGFRYGGGLVIGFAVASGENTSRNLTAVYVNDQLPPNDPAYMSRDRGPWQINDYWHPEVTDAEAFNLNQSCIEAYRISRQGDSFSQWSAYNNGRYRQFLDLGYAVYALDEALRRKDELEDDLAAANATIASLQSQVQTLTSERNAARTERDIARAQVTALQAQVAALTAQVNSLSAERDAARAERDAALAVVAEKNAAIDAAIATLQDAR